MLRKRVTEAAWHRAVGAGERLHPRNAWRLRQNFAAALRIGKCGESVNSILWIFYVRTRAALMVQGANRRQQYKRAGAKINERLCINMHA